ncbi:hypothetical protein BLOT_015820 [Blomia tropicalis]|nr:hypothetical protein BLOT_015820 [Blomia tropicalis]
MFKTFIVLCMVACSMQKNFVKYQSMTIGDHLAHPEMEIPLSDPKPYDWKNQPAAPQQPYLSEFKIAAAPSNGNPEPEGPPRPFSFGFMSMANDGTQSRQESQDASGKVTGSYEIVDAQGITRRVEYWADDSGFHAEIKSNEPGLEGSDLGSAKISKL